MKADEIEKLLIPIDRAIGSLEKLNLCREDADKFKNGMTLINYGSDANNLAVLDGEELIGKGIRELKIQLKG